MLAPQPSIHRPQTGEDDTVNRRHHFGMVRASKIGPDVTQQFTEPDLDIKLSFENGNVKMKPIPW
jgi:hypothetical protein